MEVTRQDGKHSVAVRDIWKARQRIAPMITRTPLIKSSFFSELANASVYLKFETLQPTGAFKVRGAANKILSLTPEQQQCGVTTFSTGNHGMAVAYIANQLGIKAVICISNRVPQVKVAAIRQFGAQIEVTGASQDDAEKYCRHLEKTHGLTVIQPFDDDEIIAGQGTVGLELIEDLPNIDTAIVPLSGGGLLSGVGLALKANDPSIKVIGVSMERSAVMYESLSKGKPVMLEEEDTLADSLLGGIGLDNRYTFEMVQSYMDEAVLVSEGTIAKAMAMMLDKHRIAAEGAAVAGVAALLENKVPTRHENIALIISGNNVDLSVLMDVTKAYLQS